MSGTSSPPLRHWPITFPGSAAEARTLGLGLHNVVFPCGYALELWRLHDRAESVN
jgi:hypothetical protein